MHPVYWAHLAISGYDLPFAAVASFAGKLKPIPQPGIRQDVAGMRGSLSIFLGFAGSPRERSRFLPRSPVPRRFAEFSCVSRFPLVNHEHAQDIELDVGSAK
jgi:hypothetical protein